MPVGVEEEVVHTSFFDRPAQEVARGLLGMLLVSTIGRSVTAGVITETEAYLGFDDPASHAYRGRQYPANRAIYAAPATWYVYRSYGVHWCANLVTGPRGIGAAVLLRGLFPHRGIATMQRRRGTDVLDALCSGPGKLTQATGITGRMDGIPLVEAPVRIHRGWEVPAAAMRQTPRVGITKAASWRLRYCWQPRTTS